MNRRLPPSKLRPIGWREWVSLPNLGISTIRAKIDTGARTSALHAIVHETFEKDGIPWIRFDVPIIETRSTITCSAKLIDSRDIKNTSGVPEHRYVVETTLVMGQRHWRIEASLADREQMTFDLILGRTAIRNRRLCVDPGRSYLMGPPIDLGHKKNTVFA